MTPDKGFPEATTRNGVVKPAQWLARELSPL